jgi:hypothetical protein
MVMDMVMNQVVTKQPRYDKGDVIAKSRRILKVENEDVWLVESETTDDKYYKVTAEGVCECPDHQIRGQICKHIYAVFRRVTE